jgi:hypothetical protein
MSGTPEFTPTPIILTRPKEVALMASEISGFAMTRKRLTHDMLNKPIPAYPRISSAFDNAGGASRSHQPP